MFTLIGPPADVATQQPDELSDQQQLEGRNASDCTGAAGTPCNVYARSESANCLWRRRTRTPSNARAYLNSFSADQRIYQAMIAYADRKVTAALASPGDETVHDDDRVPAAFTKAGWNAMMEALQNPGALHQRGTLGSGQQSFRARQVISAQ